MLYMKKRGGYSVNEFTSRLLSQAVHRQATSRLLYDCVRVRRLPQITRYER